MKRFFLLFFLIAVCVNTHAQFSLTGSDPAGVKWKQTRTPEFKIIYPEGEDSLATVYGKWLESARIGVSRSSGLLIGENYRSRMPVILHSFNTIPNASVVWAPKRMDFYTAPDPYGPTPIPWEKLLAIHEGRHAAQMNFGVMGRFKWTKNIFGETFAGALSGIFPGPIFLEGDAVVTETALTNSGRGRQFTFLEYYMPALDCGDWRDFWKWSYGSHKYHSPDYYKSGYLLISGCRVFFNAPLFTKEYFDRVTRKGLFFNLQKTVKAAGGADCFNSAFRVIEQANQALWAEEASLRGPFMPSRQVSRPPWRHTNYYGSVYNEDSGIWSIKVGKTVPTALVSLSPDGSEKTFRPFSGSTGDLFLDKANGRLWWSETVQHWRWTLAGSSRIRYIDISDPKRIHDLTKEGKYFNPAPSPDGRLICVTEYPIKGGSNIVLLDSSDGHVEKVIHAPYTLQITESAWISERLFVAGLSDNGMGIYEVNSFFKKILGPQPIELTNLRAFDQDEVSFLCDRTGVMELYLLDVDSGKLRQATSTRYGISNPFFSPTADSLYYSTLAPADKPESYLQGRMVYTTSFEDLPMKEVSFGDIHHWRIADALSAQEKELALAEGSLLPDLSSIEFTEPRRYNKFLPVIHSWAPLFFDYDNIDKISGNDYYNAASLGATVMFQNLVGDGYGQVGYNIHQDPDILSAWRHSGHLKLLYNGFFPVIELSADVGNRASYERIRVEQVDKEKEKTTIYTAKTRKDIPLVESSLRLYVPINLSSGGVSRGIVPQVRYRFTNDTFNEKISLREVSHDEDPPVAKEVGSLGIDHLSFTNILDISVRGYVLRDRAPSQSFPKWGFGAEAGLHTRPGLSGVFSSTAFLFMYGYVPGFLQDQGLKLSAALGKDLGGGKYSYPNMPVSFIPRGFAETNISSIVNTCSPARFKFTMDYSLPAINLDWSGLSPLIYVKNIEFTPFFDYSYQQFKVFENYHVNKAGIKSEIMTSTGTDMAFNLGNLLWLPYNCSFGVRYAYNTWKNIESFSVSGLGHHYFGLVFNMSL